MVFPLGGVVLGDGFESQFSSLAKQTFPPSRTFKHPPFTPLCLLLTRVSCWRRSGFVLQVLSALAGAAADLWRLLLSQQRCLLLQGDLRLLQRCLNRESSRTREVLRTLSREESQM